MPYYPQINQKHPSVMRGHRDAKETASYGKFNAKRKRTIPEDKTYPRSVVFYNSSNAWLHPTGKPVLLFLYLAETYTAPNDIILDPFFGSGTTGVACEQLSRKWIAIEEKEKDCEIAAKRIEAENKQLKLPGF